MTHIYNLAEDLNQENRKTIRVSDRYVNLSESSWAVLDPPKKVEYEIKVEFNNEFLTESDKNIKSELVPTTEPEKRPIIVSKEPIENAEELTDEMRKRLLELYNKQIDSATKICKNIQYSTDPELDHYKNCVKNFPKCVVRSIRQVCKCNEDCLSTFKIHEKFISCDIYDYTTDIYDNLYVECCWPYKILNGKIKYYQRRNSLENSTKKFYKEIDTLCQKADNYNITKCAVYELQDECFNDDKCKERRFAHIFEQKCENSDFDDQVEELQEIVKFSVFKFKDRPFRFAKREISNQKYYNLADNSLESTNVNGQYLCPAIFIASLICLVGGLHLKFGLSKKQVIALILSGVSLFIGYFFIF